jgi:hypothetical protein
MKKILFNPFEKLSDAVLIGFGIIFNGYVLEHC